VTTGAGRRATIQSLPSRRDEILTAARDLFTDQGFSVTTMADIAEQVGVVESALYRHFSSKQDLLLETIKKYYEPLISEMARTTAAIADPVERLRYIIWHALRTYAEDPALGRLILHEARALDKEWNTELSELSELKRQHTAFLLKAIQDGISSGVFRANVRPGLVRDLVYGATEHLALSAQPGGLDVEQLTADLMSLIEPGLRPPPRDQDLETQVLRLAELVDQIGRQLG
jgi:AcrR family transcriptional regulator